MTEKEIKKWLLRGREAQKYIEILEIYSSEAFDEACRITGAPKEINVQTSRVNSSEIKNIKYADSRRAVEIELKKLKKIRREIMDVVQTLKNDRQRTVLICYYILCKSWEEVAESLGLDMRSIYRIRDRAVSELAKGGGF